jgi:RNA polymerase primary sigma factor
MSAGMLGLLRAFDKFELGRPASFISYAKYWVEQFIRKEVAYNTNIVRIPFHSYRQLIKVRDMVREGYSNKKIQDEMNLSEKKVSLLK